VNVPGVSTGTRRDSELAVLTRFGACHCAKCRFGECRHQLRNPDYVRILFTAAHDWLLNINRRLIRLPPEYFDPIHFCGMTPYQLGIFRFNLVPAAALFMVGYRATCVERENFHFYFPLTTCIILSVVLTGIL
jgi:hypothetical protein